MIQCSSSSTEVSRKSSFELYKEASIYGAARGLCGLPIEHPFDTVKTKMQASGGRDSAWTVTKNLSRQGISSFYAGAVPNAMRVASKQMYRWPMMIGFPQFFRDYSPKEMQNPSVIKTMTGLSIASFEVCILTPMERLKVHLMTAVKTEKGITNFIRNHQGNLIAESTRGLNAMFLRQMTTWVSFLVADDKLKSLEKKRTNTEVLSFSSLMWVSFGVGAINTAANMPFDVLKTFFQQANPLENKGLIPTMKKIYSTYGVKGLYAGWQVRFAQYMIQASITVPLLDELERRAKK